MKCLIRIFAILPLLTLTSCEYYKLEKIKHVEPVGTPFQKALWSDYRDMSKDEERAYDWSQAVVYADKALRSAYGEEVPPEDPTTWELPDGLVQQFIKAREDLMGVLAGDAKDVQPQLVADAQASFDCWLEKQSENYHADQIADCREEFYDHMQELLSPKAAQEMMKRAMESKKAAPKPKPSKPPVPVAPAPAPRAMTLPPAEDLTPQPATNAEPTAEPAAPEEAAPAETPPPAEAPTPAPAPQAFSPPPVEEPVAAAAPAPAKKAAAETETASYIVFFDSGQATLTPAAEKIIDAAAESVVTKKSYKVVVNARTDVFGNASPELPQKRAQMVKDRLILQGVSESAIDVQSGEASPAAGALSQAPVDRRVEIFISE